MRGQGVAVVLAIVSIAFAGCTQEAASPASAADVPDAPEVTVSSEFGALTGIVTDDSLTAVVGADAYIRELERATVTDDSGRFTFNEVPPGDYNLFFQRIGFESVAKRVTVAAGAATELNVGLVPIAVEDPYHMTQQGVGRFMCGFGVLLPTGVPGVVGARPALAACAAGYGTPLGAYDQFKVDFQLQGQNISSLKSLIMESEWRSTQASAGGFSMYWEVYQDWGAGTVYTEDVRSIASAEGGSPLKAVANDTVFSEGFSEEWTDGSGLPKYCIENGPCKIYARSFPYADTFGTPLDASVYLDQPFTHFVTEFYGEYAADDFTALADD